MAKPKIARETKEERFKRIASARTQKILDALRLLGNCANKNIYSYSEEDVAKIFRAIEKELRRIKMLFDGTRNNKFSL